jgi:hypothetical protein
MMQLFLGKKKKSRLCGFLEAHEGVKTLRQNDTIFVL